MIYEFFKKLQLFWFGFATSASALVMAAILAGDMSHTDIQNRVAEVSLEYMQNNPEGLQSRLAEYLVYKFDNETPSVTQPVRPNTIEALQANQG